MAFLLNAPFPDCRNIEIDLIVEVEAMSHITLREGLKKKHVFYPHFVDKRFTPPLIHIGGFYNNIIKYLILSTSPETV